MSFGFKRSLKKKRENGKKVENFCNEIKSLLQNLFAFKLLDQKTTTLACVFRPETTLTIGKAAQVLCGPMATIQTSLSIWQALKNLLRFCSVQFRNIKRWVDLKTHACPLLSFNMV